VNINEENPSTGLLSPIDLGKKKNANAEEDKTLEGTKVLSCN
jgi:hypothetical protein